MGNCVISRASDYSAGTGLSLSGRTFKHADYCTAGTAGTSSATSGSSLAVPYLTMNAQGHVTGYGTHTHTVSGFAASTHTHAAGNLTIGINTGNVLCNSGSSWTSTADC